MQYMSSVL